MDVEGIIKTVAPWLGTAMGGPLGGMAVGWACEKLGIGEKTTEALKQGLISAIPEQMLALKQADLEFSAKMQELGFKQVSDLEALAVEDRKDARTTMASIRSKMPAILASVSFAGFFVVIFGLLFGLFHVSDSPIVMMLFGTLVGLVESARNFWLGTSSGSQIKTDLLAQKNL